MSVENPKDVHRGYSQLAREKIKHKHSPRMEHATRRGQDQAPDTMLRFVARPNWDLGAEALTVVHPAALPILQMGWIV
jgi:hypothetical protein